MCICVFGDYPATNDVFLCGHVLALVAAFVVIERIAGVSARFALDAVPSNKLGIEAYLSAGLIDEAAARQRLKELEDESGFFGSMDGASKFVRGDAVAG